MTISLYATNKNDIAYIKESIEGFHLVTKKHWQAF